MIVGGDTAAAVLGDGVHVAGGTVAPGIPWARRADGTGPLVVTKAGGFGDPRDAGRPARRPARQRGAMTTNPAPMAITMGDASGRRPGDRPASPRRRTASATDVVVYGDAAILRHGAELLGLDVDRRTSSNPATSATRRR